MFELELSGRIRQMPGKYFVRSDVAVSRQPSAISQSPKAAKLRKECAKRLQEYRRLGTRLATITLEVYRATERFPKSEMFGLTSQIRRAAASLPTNLAEGCGRLGRRRHWPVCSNRLGLGERGGLPDSYWRRILDYLPSQSNTKHHRPNLIEIKRMLDSPFTSEYRRCARRRKRRRCVVFQLTAKMLIADGCRLPAPLPPTGETVLAS